MFKKLLLLLTLSFLLTSCSGIFGISQDDRIDQTSSKAKGAPLDNKEASVSIEQGEGKDEDLKQRNQEPEIEYGIEVTWDIPEETVDGYVLYSGISQDKLDSEIHLRLKDLRVINQKQYSYTISPVDPEKPLFIAIAAKKESIISEKSMAQEYNPVKAKFQLH